MGLGLFLGSLHGTQTSFHPEGRVVLAAAGPQRKSGLAPISPAVGAAALRGGKQER